jgi:hypothetical protein
MRRSSVHRQRYGEPIQFLMTPLIDVTVLVISFFILAGTFASLDAVGLTVPTVHGNRPVEVIRRGDKLVINVPPLVRPAGAAAANAVQAGAAEARSYVIGGEIIRPGDTATLIDRLKQEREFLAGKMSSAAAARQVQVEVRAAVGQAGFAQVHYVAYGSPDGQ